MVCIQKKKFLVNKKKKKGRPGEQKELGALNARHGSLDSGTR